LVFEDLLAKISDEAMVGLLAEGPILQKFNRGHSE